MPHCGPKAVVILSFIRNPQAVLLLAACRTRKPDRLLGVPVLVHGTLEGAGGVASAYVFRELSVMPCSSLAQAQAQLDEGKPVFAPTAVLAPGLAELLALRGRLGLCGFAMMLAKLLAPFDGDTLHIVAAGESSVLFDAETVALRHAATLPHGVDAHSTAAWIRRALSGEAPLPLPLPLVNQIACCLYAAGCTEDMNQAKAIVAIETGSLAAA
jgi:anthranilate phosphoribosyltransferase